MSVQISLQEPPLFILSQGNLDTQVVKILHKVVHYKIALFLKTILLPISYATFSILSLLAKSYCLSKLYCSPVQTCLLET